MQGVFRKKRWIVDPGPTGVLCFAKVPRTEYGTLNSEEACVVGLKEVAAAAGVSARTVSRVMRDEANVAIETRERIRQLAKEMGYRPNLAARGLRSKRAHEVVLIAWSTAVFNDGAELHLRRIEGFEKRLTEADMPLKVRIVNPDQYPDGLPAGLLDELTARQPMGVALFPNLPEVLRAIVARLREADIPVVLLDQQETGGLQHALNVRADRQHGIKQAVHHLAGHGRRRIGYAGIDTPSRVTGYREAMAEVGQEPLIFATRVAHTSAELFHLGREVAARIAAMVDRPDAIQAYADSMAMGLIDGFRAAGVSVPGDIAVVGFDDRTCSTLCFPALTTVHLPNFELGYHAGDLILKHSLAHGEPPVERERVIPARLVVRDSA